MTFSQIYNHLIRAIGNSQIQIVLAILSATLLMLATPLKATFAHQPYFEDQGTTQSSPLSIKDPTISTTLYAPIDSLNDVDYYIFNGINDLEVFIGITIPKIEGQLNFAPTVAIIGPGLPAAILPTTISINSQPYVGSITLSPTEPQTFFEPFSRTSY